MASTATCRTTRSFACAGQQRADHRAAIDATVQLAHQQRALAAERRAFPPRPRHGFDYNGFINDILKDTVARNPSPCPHNLWGAPKDVKGWTYDMDKAKAELAKVKEPLRPITIGTLAGFARPSRPPTLLQNGAKKIGIEIKIESAPWPVMQSRMQDREKNHDMDPLGRAPITSTPTTGSARCTARATSARATTSYYKDPELDKWIDEALAINDQEKRRVLLREGGDQGHREAMGIFVYNTKWYGPYAANVERSASARSAAGRTCAGLTIIGCSTSLKTAAPLVGRHRVVARGRSMRRLEMILSRLAWFVPTLAGLVVIVFLISNVIPDRSGARSRWARTPRPTQIEAMRVKLGYDQPLWIQLRGTSATGCRAISASASTPSARSRRTWHRACRPPWNSTLVAITLSIALGIPLGVISALRRNSLCDQVVRVLSVSGLAIAALLAGDAAAIPVRDEARRGAAQRPDRRIWPAPRDRVHDHRFAARLGHGLRCTARSTTSPCRR